MKKVCFSANVHQYDIAYSVAHVQLSFLIVQLENKKCTPSTNSYV